MVEEVSAFWEELEKAYGGIDINEIFTFPTRCWERESIYGIQTKEDYIFDDAFWNIFHKYPFHICHIGLIYDPSQPRLELRFKIIPKESSIKK